MDEDDNRKFRLEKVETILEDDASDLFALHLKSLIVKYGSVCMNVSAAKNIFSALKTCSFSIFS